jgi:outer membrane biosynthesis protein TonB
VFDSLGFVSNLLNHLANPSKAKDKWQRLTEMLADFAKKVYIKNNQENKPPPPKPIEETKNSPAPKPEPKPTEEPKKLPAPTPAPKPIEEVKKLPAPKLIKEEPKKLPAPTTALPPPGKNKSKTRRDS